MGGVEKYVYEICSRLVDHYSVEVSVVCTNWDAHDNTYREETLGGISVYRLPYLLKVSSTPVHPGWTAMLRDLIRRIQPDVVNGHIPVPQIADGAVRAAHKEKVPYILTYHNDLTGYNPAVRALSRLYYLTEWNRTQELSRLIIATSEYYAQTSPYLSPHLDKIRIVSPGVDIEKYRMLQTDHIRRTFGLGDEKIILFVGQLNRESQHKGLEDLITAISHVNRSFDARLVVVGKGDYLEHYRRHAEREGVDKYVIFAGYVADEEIVHYFCGSDVMVLPSYNRAEGFGMVLIEAQACGTPVIGTTMGGIRAAVRDHETGLLVPPREPKKIAGAIQEILQDSSCSEQMGLSGYRWVREKFSWQKSTSDFFSVACEGAGR
ncbi:glycosyltransferase [Methanofollis fontis]|nr:glycosyltransferase [Methanofollis fontis]